MNTMFVTLFASAWNTQNIWHNHMSKLKQ